MATANSTATRSKPITKRAVVARMRAQPQVLDKPMAGLRNDGPRPMAARKYMLAKERRIVDKALDILGSYMRGSACVLTSTNSVSQYACLHLGALPFEAFGVLFLDAQHSLIAYESMFRGTLTQTSVYPREVAIQALLYNAAAVVLTHNHPSGSCNPSKADIALTETLKRALALVDVRVLDHVIVSGNQAVSMVELGLL
jgi:DNA repair protein RadC